MSWCMRNRRDGQGLVEFVLVMPILLLLFMGIIEFARGWNIRHVVTDAAREGARNLVVDQWGGASAEVVRDSVESIIGHALAASSLSIDDAEVDIVICDGGTCASPDVRKRGEAARVSINYPYELGLLRAFLGWAVEDGQLDIGTTFVMRNE